MLCSTVIGTIEEIVEVVATIEATEDVEVAVEVDMIVEEIVTVIIDGVHVPHEMTEIVGGKWKTQSVHYKTH